MASLVLIVIALGLRVWPGELRAEFARPAPLLRALFAIGVVMPALTIGAAMVFTIDPLIETALVALALSPLPPALVLKHDGVGGSKAYSATLLVVTGVCAVGLIPAWLIVLGHIPGLTADVATVRVVA